MPQMTNLLPLTAAEAHTYLEANSQIWQRLKGYIFRVQRRHKKAFCIFLIFTIQLQKEYG